MSGMPNASGQRPAIMSLFIFIAVLSLAVSESQAKTTVTREYGRSVDLIFNIVSKALPELGQKVTNVDKLNCVFTFVTKGNREMHVKVIGKGKDISSVEVTGSAWFSNEPQEVADKIHAKINDFLVKAEAQKIASAQKSSHQARPAVQNAQKTESPEKKTIEPKTSESGMSEADYLEVVSNTAGLMKRGATTLLMLCSKYTRIITEIEEMHRDILKPLYDPGQRRELEATREGRQFMQKILREKAEGINKTCNTQLSEVREKLKQVNHTIVSTMKQLTNPPEKYATLHTRVVDLYGAYAQMMKTAFNPPDGFGMPNSYEIWARQVDTATKEFEKASSAVQVLIPSASK